MNNDLLLEIGTEEIPARFIPDILQQLEATASLLLNEQRIDHGNINVWGTPRRLVLSIRDVAPVQADRQTKTKGPSVKIAFDSDGNASKAALGFARSQGVNPAQLLQEDGYIFAVIEERGAQVQALLPQLLTDLLGKLHFPKSMRWGDLELRFVRPIRWLLALYGSELIPFTYAAVSTEPISYGHRFLSEGALTIESPADYLSKLSQHFVMVDQDQRRSVIREQVESLAIAAGGKAVIDEDLLSEVVFLVEYPTALCGEFDPAYLSLPPEAIITPMREHQRYFPVKNADGKLLPKFITVRNGGEEHLAVVRRGNERVLRARLADAKFFYEEDQKIPLPQRLEKLKTIVFQEGLGSLHDKTLRLQRLATDICHTLQQATAEPVVVRAAELAKADLVTGMVREFTELQGIMGQEYALLAGEHVDVATAIYEHYLPRFAGDCLPKTIAGQIVSIADKVDNIAATFSRGLIPTGSQDPYALRRQALGICNIVLEAQLPLSLRQVFSRALELLTVEPVAQEQLLLDISEFFRIRFKGLLTERGIRYDVIDAVLAVGFDEIYDTYLRAEALEQLNEASRYKLTQAFTRTSNLAKQATTTVVKPELFVAEAESILYERLTLVKAQLVELVAVKNYVDSLELLTGLAEPIDQFFNEVMIMVDDDAIKTNRLALLKTVIALTAPIADLGKLVIQND